MQSLPPSFKIDNHKECEVHKILNSQQKIRGLEYFVHWSGYDVNEPTWKLAKSLANVTEKIPKFH